MYSPPHAHTNPSPQDDLERLRAVYEQFLALFPLCYGYWKKFADSEARHGSTEASLAVFERGVCATPYSMDLWAHYAAAKRAHGGSVDDVRRCVLRASSVAVLLQAMETTAPCWSIDAAAVHSRPCACTLGCWLRYLPKPCLLAVAQESVHAACHARWF